MDPISLFNLIIYQPFFNLLLGIYWLLGFFTQGQPDMGIAVIILTVIIRVLLLPMSLAGHESEADRRRIANELKEIEDKYGHDPDKYKLARKKVFHRDRRVVISEMASLFVQVTTALMLWRMFGTGLTGKDLNLVYDFMPQIQYPYNMMFLGRIDLSHGSLTLNLIQSFLIFLLETISVFTSPYPPSRGEVVRLQLVLPVVSFFIFLSLPAGKKLFVITTLIFSIILVSVKAVQRRFWDYKARKEAEEAAAASDITDELDAGPPQEQLLFKF